MTDTTMKLGFISVPSNFDSSQTLDIRKSHALSEAELLLPPLVENMTEAHFEISPLDEQLHGIESNEVSDNFFTKLNDSLSFIHKLEPEDLKLLNLKAAQAVSSKVNLAEFIDPNSIIVTPFFTAYRDKQGEVFFTLNTGFKKVEERWVPDHLIPNKVVITNAKPANPGYQGHGTGTRQGKGRFPFGWIFTVAIIAASVFAATNKSGASNTDVHGGDGQSSGGLSGGARHTQEVPVPTYIASPSPTYTPMVDLIPSPTAPPTDIPEPVETPTPIIETESFPLNNGESVTMNSYSADQGNSAMDEVINIEGCKTNIDRFEQVNPEFDTIFNQVLMQIPGLGRNEISYVNYEDQQTGDKYRMIVYEISNSEDGQPQTVIVYLNRNNEVKTVLIRDKFINVYESIKGYSRDGRLVKPYTVIIN
jgi:hypothetical protein